jgi:hypothetical protein
MPPSFVEDRVLPATDEDGSDSLTTGPLDDVPFELWVEAATLEDVPVDAPESSATETWWKVEQPQRTAPKTITPRMLDLYHF